MSFSSILQYLLLSACFKVLCEQELGNVLTEHRYICQESDPGGLYPPATFHPLTGEEVRVREREEGC